MCVVCERPLVEGEKYVCLHCSVDIPQVTVGSLTDNEIHVPLASRMPIEKGMALFHYRRGSPYTRMIHEAKYGDRPQLARWLGEQLAMKCEPTGFFNDIDVLVPVPLSRWRLIRRGYNQSAMIARGIAEITGLPVVDVLKARHHGSQTRRNAMSRRDNTKNVYSVKDCRKLEGVTHVAIVDDVVTTGSTMLDCAAALYSLRSDLRISVLCVGLSEL